MTRDEARQILGDAIQPDGRLKQVVEWISWSPGDKYIWCDGQSFTEELLEAIVVWVRAHRRNE